MDLDYYMQRSDYLVCGCCGILTDIREWQHVDECPSCGESIEFAIDHVDLELNNDVIQGETYI